MGHMWARTSEPLPPVAPSVLPGGLQPQYDLPVFMSLAIRLIAWAELTTFDADAGRDMLGLDDVAPWRALTDAC